MVTEISMKNNHPVAEEHDVFSKLFIQHING